MHLSSPSRTLHPLVGGRTLRRLVGGRTLRRLVAGRTLRLLLAGALGATAWPSDAGASAGWRLPAAGLLVAGFHFDSLHPYRAGQRRDATFAVPPRATVGAACPGRVTFAGRLPRGGLVVAEACGAFSVTYVGLGAIFTRAGRRLAPGTPLGRAGPSGRLGLGARRLDERNGYVDPLALIGVPAAPRVPGGPRGPRTRPVPLARWPAPPAARPLAVPSTTGLPAGAWWLPTGFALLAGAALVGLGRAARAARAARVRVRPAPRPTPARVLPRWVRARPR